MAEIIEQEKAAKGQKKRPKKGSAHVDMTPMVDLMCLLITFFMLTTAFSKPKVMEITMPEKDNHGPITKIPEKRTYTILIGGNDQLFWYNGVIIKGKPIPVLNKSTYGKDGIRKLLLEKNRRVFKEVADLKEKVISGKLRIADSTLTRMIRDIKKKDKNPLFSLLKQMTRQNTEILSISLMKWQSATSRVMPLWILHHLRLN